MKFIAMFYLLFFSFVWAQDVKIETQPSKPVAGEVFQLVFRIFTDLESEPVINFSPAGLEVVGKSNLGVSTRTIYANGKITVTREISVSYEMVAQKVGYVHLRDIQVDLGSKKLRLPTYNLNILKEPEETPDVFLRAEVTKRNVFVGEGITVRYFLYSRVGVSSLDVKTYPKLNNFLKRFLQEPDTSERVSMDGAIFVRTKIYSARIFPEKIGLLKIDPMTIAIAYQPSLAVNPFGTFNSGGVKRKTIKNDEVQIEVNPLPEPKPQSFTGLVGAHKFDLTQNTQKVLVNEPLEFKLVVSGPGALENLEAPKIFNFDGFEEFETNGDLKISGDQSAVKELSYTFLPKKPTTIPDKGLELSYFDPDSKKYIPTQLRISQITVGGTEQISVKKNEETSPPVETTSVLQKTINQKLSFDPTQLSILQLNKLLICLILLLGSIPCVVWLVGIIKRTNLNPFDHSIPSTFKKGDIHHNLLMKWLAPLHESKDKDLRQSIDDADVSQEAKRYFYELLDTTSRNEYAKRSDQKKTIFNKKYFTEMKKFIERSHENLH